MHFSNLGVYQLLSITSVCYALSYAIRSRVSILQPSQQYIIHYRHIREGRRRLSVECTSPTLLSISSSPSPLSASLRPMSIHRSVQELEFYCIINRLTPIFPMLESHFGGPLIFVRKRHTSNFGNCQLLSITSVC